MKSGISQNYRQILKEALADRCKRNQRYSMRAFARDLDISAPRLSHILKGNFGLSRDAAAKISKKLNFTESESDLFCDLVESEHARTKSNRTIAKERIQKQSTHFSDLTLDHFRIISEWYHYAIMELTLVEGFKYDFNWIAGRLQISPYEVEVAIGRLLKLEMLEEHKKTLKITGSYFTNDAGIPSDAVKQFHLQVLEKAKSALLYQSTEDRDFRSVTLAVDREDIPKAKEMIKQFAKEFDQALSKGKKKSEVYQLSLQFFSTERSPVLIETKPNKK